MSCVMIGEPLFTSSRDLCEPYKIRTEQIRTDFVNQKRGKSSPKSGSRALFMLNKYLAQES